MTNWTYCATHLLTGKVLADTIPLDVQSFGAAINGSGTLTGAVDLSEAYAANEPSISAVAARKAMLWALADGYPMWAGLLWDWPDMSRQQGALPVSAQTIDSLFGKRLITDTLEYRGVDLYTAFLDLCRYGMTKRSSYISSVSPPATRPAGYLSLMATNGRVARLVLPEGINSGVSWTAGYAYSDLSAVSAAWSDMCASGSLQYYFEPGIDSEGELCIYLRLGYTQLGRPLADSNLKLTYPGNCSDYGYTITGSQSSNYVWATAPPNGAQLQWQSVYPHGADLADITGGDYPVLESTASWQGSVVTQQAQINSFADGQVALTTSGMTTPIVKLAGESRPSLADVKMGDAAFLSFTSPLHPPGPSGEPGLEQEVRVTGWTEYPNGPGQSEYCQLTTSAVSGASLFPTKLGAERVGSVLRQLQRDVAKLKTRTAGIDSGFPLAALPGVISPSYTSGLPEVYVNGSATLTGPYGYLSSYTPHAGDTVLLAPVGVLQAYVIIGRY